MVLKIRTHFPCATENSASFRCKKVNRRLIIVRAKGYFAPLDAAGIQIYCYLFYCYLCYGLKKELTLTPRP